ncbi:hypothetical protein [Williamsia sterculiae]|uniref:Uncharacterized protein n=1 Tax=Williamsia sterculiae TaxID=1344003 RepID=A0A1N7GFH3_9NOCA|nr:hypothetical protein [Williamsia sterculiae]SIS11321.1 hypothetical protein SAMN05445060_2725 [Williamsia sterculiae]
MVRVVANKKIDLTGLYEGWGNDCYAVVRPCTTEEVKGFFTRAQAKDANGDVLQDDLIREHFVSCRGLVVDDDGKESVGDLTVDDVVELPDLSDKIAAACIRSDLDPKALREAALSSMQSIGDEKSTATR